MYIKDVPLKKSDFWGCNVFQVGICDDGKNVCAYIEDILLQYAKECNVKIETNIWYSGEGLRNYLSLGNHVDILFLDIELLKMTGIEVGNYIRKQLDNIEMQIIYISGEASYAQQLFKTRPFDFLVKPISQEQIHEVMDEAIKVIEKKNRRFEFQQGKDYHYVPMGDIIYLESKGRKIKVVTLKNSLEFYGKLKETAPSLSEDFIAIHQSYIVNREHIIRYAYETVELIDGTTLTISPVNRKRVRERLLREA